MNNDNKALEGQTTEITEEKTEERLFTQDEVNRIIKQRLSKVKETNMATEEEIAKLAAEATASRNAELDKKEQLLNCRSYLIEKGYPVQLLDSLDTSNADAFKKKADSLVNALTGALRGAYTVPLGTPEPVVTGRTMLQQAFSADTKHEPKKWPPQYDE